MYRDGHNVTADLDKAEKLLEAACGGGAPFACTNAGDLAVRRGKLDASIQHYKKGCDAGDAIACRHMGIAYLEGKGLPSSTSAASVWLDRGCRGDDPIACRVLGAMRLQGIGVAKDEAIARSLLSRACAKKDTEACSALDSIGAGSGSNAGSGSGSSAGSGSGVR
jgi:TPR repeat protein